MKTATLVRVLVVGGLAVGAYVAGLASRRGGAGTNNAPITADAVIGFSPRDVDLGRQPWYAEVPFTATFMNGTD